MITDKLHAILCDSQIKLSTVPILDFAVKERLIRMRRRYSTEFHIPESYDNFLRGKIESTSKLKANQARHENRNLLLEPWQRDRFKRVYAE